VGPRLRRQTATEGREGTGSGSARAVATLSSLLAFGPQGCVAWPVRPAWAQPGAASAVPCTHWGSARRAGQERAGARGHSAGHWLGAGLSSLQALRKISALFCCFLGAPAAAEAPLQQGELQLAAPGLLQTKRTETDARARSGSLGAGGHPGLPAHCCSRSLPRGRAKGPVERQGDFFPV